MQVDSTLESLGISSAVGRNPQVEDAKHFDARRFRAGYEGSDPDDVYAVLDEVRLDVRSEVSEAAAILAFWIDYYEAFAGQLDVPVSRDDLKALLESLAAHKEVTG
jgi:hypothetical protein